jgi:hypothetical protein
MHVPHAQSLLHVRAVEVVSARMRCGALVGCGTAALLCGKQEFLDVFLATYLSFFGTELQFLVWCLLETRTHAHTDTHTHAY